MSTKPSQVLDPDATGVIDLPAAAPASDPNVTGAFEVPPSNGTEMTERTTELPPEDGGVTAILPVELAPETIYVAEGQPQPATSEATAVLSPEPRADAGSPSPDDVTVAGGTGIYQSPASDGTAVYQAQDTDGTAVYEHDSTKAREKNGPTWRQPNSDATGVYDTAASESGGLSGATCLLDGTSTDAGKDAAKSAPESDVPRCGNYLLKRFHAKGGMGEIWLAEDSQIGRSVALKRMLSNRPDQQRRFRIEAQVTGQLEHPGIVPIHELGFNAEGQPFYTMKFVHGETLQKVIDDHHTATAGDREVQRFRLLQIFLSLCQTVAYAHSRGVLHRDLKPENVMLGPYGETLLLDWGIAKVMGQPEDTPANGEGEAEYVHLLESGTDSETRAGTIMGSLSYISPEVARGKNKEADQRSDVFLLGGILYAMLTGRPPRQGKNPMELIKQAQKQLPPSPRKVNPQIPKSLDAICMKALALEREDRYPSALKLAEDIQLYSVGEPVSAYRETFVERAERWARRHRKGLTQAALALVVLCLLVFGYFKYRQVEAQWATEKLADQKRVEEANEKTRIEKEDKERLQRLNQARDEVKNFSALSDEARFFAATTDPVAEKAPYFDPHEGEKKAKTALQVAKTWGPNLEQLPPEIEREPLRKDLYALVLLLTQGEIQQGTTAENIREALALLEDAKQYREPSQGYYRIRALAQQRLAGPNRAVLSSALGLPGGIQNQQQFDELEMAAADQLLAENANTPATAQDYFLKGEQFRKDSYGLGDKDGERKLGQADRELMGKAIKAYREALKIDRNDYWSYFQLGRAYMALGNYAQAAETLGACIALKPNAPWGYSVRGMALAQLGASGALDDLNRAVELDADFLPARLNRGVYYWIQKQYDLALADFARVLELPKEKRLIEAAFYRGQLYAQKSDTAAALRDFDLVVAEKPSLKDVYLYRARTYIALGQNLRYHVALGLVGGVLPGVSMAEFQNRRALDDLSTFLALTNGPSFRRDDWQGYGRRGHLLRNLFLELPQDQRDKPSGRELLALALRELNKAIALGGLQRRVYDDLGTMYFHAGQADKALDAFDKALALYPKDVFVLVERGELYDALGQRDKALADFEAACRVDPEHGGAHSWVGYELAIKKMPSAAMREAELALLYSKNKYLVLHNVACIYATLALSGDPEADAYDDVAIALLRQAIQLWKSAGTGLDEIEQIKAEPAFARLRKHRDYPSLIGEAKP